MNSDPYTKSKDYGMFTEEGNIAIGAVVTIARAGRLTWPETYRMLYALAIGNREEFGEATDTEVRELVYNAIGAYDRNEDFYC
jgi:hypothetical protein